MMDTKSVLADADNAREVDEIADRQYRAAMASMERTRKAAVAAVLDEVASTIYDERRKHRAKMRGLVEQDTGD